MSASHPEDVVLLVSTDLELSRPLQEAFRSGALPLACEHDAERGFRRAADGSAQLVIVDASLFTDAARAVRRLRAATSVPLIVVAACGDDADAIVLLESGADDCICRPVVAGEALARARAVLRRVGGRSERAGRLSVGGIDVWPGSRSARVNGRPVSLTAAEYDLLASLAHSAGRIVSREDLIKAAFRRDASPFDRSLDVHISRLRRKLHPRDGQIVTVRGVGYMLATD